MASHREIGLFPLPVVLVPGELVPLHIFEPRYRTLIAEAIEGERQFALLYADDDGAREVGCTADLVEVLERFDDGRMNVVVRGGEVVRVVEITHGHPYMTGLVEPCRDDLAHGGEAEAALELYRMVANAAGGEPDDAVGSSGGVLSWEIAARIEFPAPEKQRLLELRSERRRLDELVTLLRRGLERIAAVAAIRERAHGNGKVEPPGRA
ncbi:MAG TPA: LON peptidase substrate-binding domain-containing protein [Gaiellales bacterium]|nr:LON peptidase substrate-binding domain-containing protein [Gaiellales bacterium]